MIDQLDEALFMLRDMFACADPHPVAIYVARYLVTEFDGDVLPGWVKLLSSESPEGWNDEVVMMVRKGMKELV